MDEKNQLIKFAYLEIPALRFIGVDAWRTKERWDDIWRRKEEFLLMLEEKIKERICPVIPYPCAFMHHDDGEVDVVNRYLVGHFLTRKHLCPKAMITAT